MLIATFCSALLVKASSNKWTSKKVAHSNWRQKRRGKDTCMFFSLIYFFAPFSIFYIPHNYVILQAMPYAILQTHSAFYPHCTWYTLISRNWKELATMSCNVIIITILKVFPTKKLKIQMLNVCGVVYAE